VIHSTKVQAEIDAYRAAEALEIATETLRATPSVWGQWLERETAAAIGGVCWVTAVNHMRNGTRDLTVPELLAVIACGNDSDLAQARFQLVEHFDRAHRSMAEEDARDLLRGKTRDDLEIEAWGEAMGYTF